MRGLLWVVVAALFVAGMAAAITQGNEEAARVDSSATSATSTSTPTTTPLPTTLLLVAPTTASTTTTTARPAPPVAQLAKPGLHLVALDGTARPAYDAATLQPSWSPDGRRLAFGRRLGGGSEITLAIGDLDGQSAQGFGEVRQNWYPRWSPSDKWIGMRALAFGAPTQVGLDRVLVNVASGAATILPGGEGAAGRWHPTDDRYLYAVGAASQIYDATSGTSSVIAFPSDGLVAWSPSGDQIAGCADGKVRIANVDGSAQRVVADIGACKLVNDCALCGGVFEWSVAGILAIGPGGQAMRIAPTTGARTPLGKTSTWATWSPTDPNLVALTQMEDGAPTVVVMRADGTSPRTLARGPVGASIPYVAWAPAGDRLGVVVDPPS